MIEPIQSDLAEAVRPLSAAEELAARAAGQPMPSLHIGSANLESRATCNSTVLPRSPADVPEPSGQRRYRMHLHH